MFNEDQYRSKIPTQSEYPPPKKNAVWRRGMRPPRLPVRLRLPDGPVRLRRRTDSVASRNRASNILCNTDIRAQNFLRSKIQRGSEARTSDAVSRI